MHSCRCIIFLSIDECFHLFYFAHRTYAVFKFEFDSKEFEFIKEFVKRKTFFLVFWGHGPKPFFCNCTRPSGQSAPTHLATMIRNTAGQGNCPVDGAWCCLPPPQHPPPLRTLAASLEAHSVCGPTTKSSGRRKPSNQRGSEPKQRLIPFHWILLKIDDWRNWL
jgi:hypothetical protein